MPVSHEAVGTAAPSLISDSDSDLDINPQELGPAHQPESLFEQTNSSQWSPTRNQERNTAQRGSQRQSSLRDSRKAISARSELARSQRQDESFRLVDYRLADKEDRQGTLHDSIQDGGTSRGVRPDSGSSGDDVPLLPQASIRRLELKKEKGQWARLKAWFPFFRFRSSRLIERIERPHGPTGSRIVWVGQPQAVKYPVNAVSNAKYTAWSFLPVTLYKEFSFFLNLYFLLVALSQIIPALRIGYLSTYVAPLIFVLSITLGKEAVDDLGRRRRDAEANSIGYTVLMPKVQTYDDDLRTGGLQRQRRKDRSTRSGANLGGRRTHKVRFSEAETEEEVHHANDGGKASRPFDEILKKSRDLKVGDILRLCKGQRVPADVVILGSFSNEVPASANALETADHANSVSGQASASIDRDVAGETFIRTEQLDGETDWKLRLASPLTQSLDGHDLRKIKIRAGRPERSINQFVGTIEISEGHERYAEQADASLLQDHAETLNDPDPGQSSKTRSAPLTVDNTAWTNTVIASNSITLAAVVYTGSQTRQAMSTSQSRSKTGLLDYEINALTKILCILTLSLSIVLVALEKFESTENKKWYITVMRFLILFSTIIPINLRVNLDLGKTVYSWFIEKDEGIKGAIVRTSTIPEELGRIEYLLSDKTGTLTQNDMVLKKIHVGTVSYANEAMEEVGSYVRQAFRGASPDTDAPFALVTPSSAYNAPMNSTSATRTRREIGSRVRDVVLALALCHNVTPTTEEIDGKSITTYQASSPDEIAIVRWTESVGLRLSHRDRKMIVLESTGTGRVVVRARILEVFPFTSEGKRMGIVAEFLDDSQSANTSDGTNGEIWFYQKGADTVMSSIVAANDWLEEETSNMAREGLRTLVVGRKKLSKAKYAEFSLAYRQASLTLHDRDDVVAKVIQDNLEQDLELLGVTGVEDKLQQDVKPSIELLRNAGIKIWMLTGDKVETAKCVAISARLVARGQYIHTITKLKRVDAAHDSLEFLRSKTDASLLIDGESLALLLIHFRDAFTSIAVLLPTVIACRCSPTQKAEIAQLIRAHTRKRVCCIGDGGNDVSMIQAADVGVGIVGKEGRQASLAADFSIEQFCHLPKLLVWHGRNSYKRSAKLAQFVIHRGLIISVCQTMFSIASKFEPIALYRDWLLVGYATVYTMAPVFSLVLDKDVDEGLAKLYPELYRELTLGRSLSYRTFFVWVLVSIYQGTIIQGLSQLLVDVHGSRMLAVSFTVLVLNELVMVAFEVTTWHPIMILALLGTGLLYFGTVPFLGTYFDLGFIITLGFLWRCAAILAASLIPPYALKIVRRTWKPPSYRKVQAV